MKKFALISIVLLIVLSSLSAAESYTGSGVTYTAGSATLPLSIDSSTWLYAKDVKSEIGIAYCGFYTGYQSMSGEKLVFKEEQQGTSKDAAGNTIMNYTAKATFTVYLYILANSSATATLTWTDLKNGSDTISFAVDNDATKSLEVYKFDPADGIFKHVDKEMTALASYSFSVTDISADTWEPKTYTGTMTLNLVIT